MRPLRILHVTTALNIGGAEMMILKLATHGQFESGVLGLLNWDVVGSMLRDRNVPVTALRLSTAAGLLGSPAVVRRVLTDFAPDVIQGWLYHGNLMAALLGRAYGAPVVWNIRQSLHTREMEKRHASMTRKVLTWLHRMPAKIVYNSAVARTEHERIGFPRDKGIVIPNGFDIDKFRPDPTAQ
ncbi:MAG TPA: glycosyltransferase, partial [Tepidisphaeraceae bacterium]